MLSLAVLAASCSGGGGTRSDEFGPDDGHAAPLTTNADYDYDVERYDLVGELDWARRRLVATVGITLRHRGLETVTLDSAVTEVKAVRLAQGESLSFTVDAEHRKLQVHLPSHARHRVRLEVDYEAEGAFSANQEQAAQLFMVPALKGDPSPVRVAFTYSEPFGAQWWMPSHDTPSDRALFSVDMRMPPEEKLIANGNFIFDERDDKTNTHRTKFDSGFTLPPYLMAFSVGDLEVETLHVQGGAEKRDLPLSIWHRRGIPNDYRKTLGETARMLKTFEALVGPYPFDSYSTVFMPGGGGEENATVTLLDESSLDYSLYDGVNVAGHELAHHWFGDLVTNESFYDAWFKEGMATLMEMENMRVYLDEENVGTLGSDRRPPKEGEPVVRDRSVPLLPYGTGPYARAAWVLSQIRSLIGDAAFWGTLRQVLRTHRYGTIDTSAFIDAFAPRLGPDATARVRHAVVAKSIPRLHVEPSLSGAFVTLRDPDGALVVPLGVRWIAPDGTVRNQTLDLDAQIELAPRTAGEFLLIDPLDVHSDAKVFATQDGAASGTNYEKSIVPLLVPKGPAAIAAWLRAGGIHQVALLFRTMPELAPADFAAFLAGLDAEGAKALAVQRACDVAADPKLPPSERTAWSKEIARALLVPPPAVGLRDIRRQRLGECSKVVDVESLFAADWAKLETGLPSGGMPEYRISYFANLDLPAARAFSIWSNVATRANSLNARGLAVANLGLYTFNSAVPAEAIPSWRAFFSRLLSQSETYTVLYNAIYAAVDIKANTAAENADALAGLNTVLHDPVDDWFGTIHPNAVCAAYALIPGAPASTEWIDFANGLADADLRPSARAYVDEPSRCAPGLPF